MDAYQIILTCWNYGDPIPYTATNNTIFTDEKDARIEMLTLITEELNELNRPLDDGTRPERYFDISLVDEKFDAVIRCWDGDSYDYVTGYKIVPITI